MLSVATVLGVFFIYIIVLLIIAAYANYKEKQQSTQGYFTSGGSISWFTLIMTYLASLMSTWVFFAGPGGYYRGGLTFWISELSYIPLFAVIVHFVMNNVWIVNKEMGFVTPADFFCARYKSKVLRVVLSLIYLGCSFPYVASILVALGQAAGIATGGAADYTTFVVIIGVVMTLFVMFGGMKSVANADTFQGLAFIAILWAIVIAVLKVGFNGSLTNAFSTVYENTNSWFSYPGPKNAVTYSSRLGYPLSCAVGWTIMLPNVFVRSGYSSESLGAQRKLSVAVPILQTLVWTGTMLIGLIGIGMLPNLGVSETELIIPYLVENFVVKLSPIVADALMIGFFVGGLAVGLSTANGFLLVAGSIVYEDIIKNTLKIELKEKNQMKIAKLITGLMGIISIFLALNPPELIWTLIMFAIAIVMPLFPILVLGIYWKKATKQAAIISAVVGTFLVLMTYFVWDVGNTWYGAIGMLASTILMVVVSLVTKQDPEDSKSFYEALENGRNKAYEVEKVGNN